MSDRQFWAYATRNARATRTGPHPTRQAAIDAVRAQPAPTKKVRHDTITSGYGNGGPYFDIQFDARVA